MNEIHHHRCHHHNHKNVILSIYFYFEQYLFGGAQFSWIEWGPDEKKKTTQKTITDKKNWNN